MLFQSKLKLRKPNPWKPEPSVRRTGLLLFMMPGGISYEQQKERRRRDPEWHINGRHDGVLRTKNR